MEPIACGLPLQRELLIVADAQFLTLYASTIGVRTGKQPTTEMTIKSGGKWACAY